MGIKNVTNLINEEDVIAINGKTGEIFINPSKEEEKNLIEIKEKSDDIKKELEEYKNKPSITKDGHQVELMANIGDVSDINIVTENTRYWWRKKFEIYETSTRGKSIFRI